MCDSYIQYKLSTPSCVINEKTLYVLESKAWGTIWPIPAFIKNNHNPESGQMYMNTVGKQP